MTKTELRKFERLLLEQKQRLLRQTNFSTEVMAANAPGVTGDLSSHRSHVADQGTESYQTELAARHRGRESQALREVEEALRRVAAGTYGNCDVCGKPIAKARLELMPAARLCVKHAAAKG
jgi:RNA polymerase-binding protein DksA